MDEWVIVENSGNIGAFKKADIVSLVLFQASAQQPEVELVARLRGDERGASFLGAREVWSVLSQLGLHEAFGVAPPKEAVSVQ